MGEKRDMRTAICQCCQQPFEVKARYSKVPSTHGQDFTQLKNRTCPGCQQKNKKSKDAKYTASLKTTKGRPNRRKVAHVSLTKVGETLNLSRVNAVKVEQQALKKLRNDPELVALFKDWIEEGGQAPPQISTEQQEQIQSAELVDYMLEISRWYETYHNLGEDGHDKEALQCLREIKKAYKTLKKKLQELSIVTD